MDGKEHTATESELMMRNAFFDWLRLNIDGVFSDESVQRTVSHKLEAIDPAIRWEAGPYDDETNFFAFSPNLSIDRLPTTESLAKAAPELPGWVFLSSKPRKKWKSRTIQIKDDNNKVVHYNFDQWLYYLTSFNDGQLFDVNLVPFECEGKPQDELQHAASLFVEFELGERMFIEFIDRTNIVLLSDLDVFGNKIENLYEQVFHELSKQSRH